MGRWIQSLQYAYRYARQKADAFKAFDGRLAAGTHVPHSVVTPLATYSPWLADSEFQATFKAIQASTLVDVYRCYELW